MASLDNTFSIHLTNVASPIHGAVQRSLRDPSSFLRSIVCSGAISLCTIEIFYLSDIASHFCLCLSSISELPTRALSARPLSVIQMVCISLLEVV